VNSQPAPITAVNHTLDNEPQQITAPLPFGGVPGAEGEG
jgi:hypothetical protein